MAACSDLELEEKSSEERLPRPVRTEDAMSQSANLNTCNEVISSYRIPENSPQPEEQSETGDLNKLSDDEFLHLLEEASTFNKPNNQESVLLKQLRKEVAETDPCDNVSRTKPARVSDGSHSKRSKHPSGYCKNRESGLVRSGATDSDTVSLPQRTLDYNARRKNEKLGRSREYPNIKNNAILTTSGLGKSGHQSQSLQDLVNSDLVKSSGHSYRKLQRAQRAASFSSAPEDQDSELEFESLRTSFKSSKRTKQQMHSSVSFGAVSESASNSNDKSKTPSSSKHDSEETKSRNRRLSTSEIQDTNTSSLPLTSSSDPMDSPSKAEKKDLILHESPSDSQEIEMKDISSVTVVEESPGDSQCAKSDQQSSSKFYVNYSADVDSTVPFPLKLVSTNGEINKSGLVNEAMNDRLTCQQVNFPMPWTRPMQVHSFLSSLPSEHDTYGKKEKQIFGSDVNGNPFSKTSRSANITSFVSATLLDYPGNNTMISENQTAKLDWSHRKNKRTRNNVENRNVMFSENIAGHRGKESIEALLKFINSDDSKTKNGKGSNSNQSITNKSAITQESDKKKIVGKGLKNCHNKNIINTAKKKMPSPSNSEEECAPANHEPKPEVTDSEILPGSISKDVKTVETPGYRNLDVNSNITADDSIKEKSEKEVSPLMDSPLKPVASISLRNTSPSAFDQYAPTESQSCQEEEDFLEVKKKPRKKHAGKRNESYRWHSAVARASQNSPDTRDYYATGTTERCQNRGNMHMLLTGMQLPQRNQSGKKQDSRRKSTSSVPHSEQSSADNSDLDSVHSLPVKGSARHPTQPQPHTSPSSSSSTPQASYADIAKMPVSSKLSPPPFCESPPTDPTITKFPNKLTDLTSREHSEVPPASSELEILSQSKTAQTQTPTVFAKSSPCGTVENENSVPCARTSSYIAKSTREINTQTDLVAGQCLPQNDRSKDKTATGPRQVKGDVSVHSRNFSHSQVAEHRKPCSICLNTYNCNCNLKSDRNIPKGQRVSRNKRPAVIMRNDHVPSDVSDISFGVDINEVCNENLGENSRYTASVDSTSHCASLPSSISLVIPGEQLNEKSVSTELPTSTSATAFSGSDIGLQVNTGSPPEGVPHRISSPPQVTLRNGQIIGFIEPSYEFTAYHRVDDLISHLAESFEEIEKYSKTKYWPEDMQ